MCSSDRSTLGSIDTVEHPRPLIAGAAPGQPEVRATVENLVNRVGFAQTADPPHSKPDAAQNKLAFLPCSTCYTIVSD
jgi:hypothetical protein